MSRSTRQGGFAATTPTSETICARFDEGPVWIALLDGAVVGTVAAVLRDEAILYVRSMAVLPAARGHNIGGTLLGEVERFAVRAWLRAAATQYHSVPRTRHTGFTSAKDSIASWMARPTSLARRCSPWLRRFAKCPLAVC